MKCILCSSPHVLIEKRKQPWLRGWKRDLKVLNRTLKFELQGKTSQTSASSLHHLVGCVLASKKFWRLLWGSGWVVKRRKPCRGLRCLYFLWPSVLGFPDGGDWDGYFAFLNFPAEHGETALIERQCECSWGGRWLGQLLKAGEYGVCFVCPVTKPILSCLVAHKTDENINFLDLKITGHLPQGIFLP